jgi:hypothetical protein
MPSLLDKRYGRHWSSTGVREIKRATRGNALEHGRIATQTDKTTEKSKRKWRTQQPHSNNERIVFWRRIGKNRGCRGSGKSQNQEEGKETTAKSVLGAEENGI